MHIHIDMSMMDMQIDVTAVPFQAAGRKGDRSIAADGRDAVRGCQAISSRLRFLGSEAKQSLGPLGHDPSDRQGRGRGR